MDFTERIIIGATMMALTIWFVGTKIDDALGHDDRSLLIGVVGAIVAGTVVALITIWWARRAER